MGCLSDWGKRKLFHLFAVVFLIRNILDVTAKNSENKNIKRKIEVFIIPLARDILLIMLAF